MPGQKRASSETLQPEYTPKRAKSFPSSSSSSNVSPSIKNWLKRSASDTVTVTEENKSKVPKLTEAKSEFIESGESSDITKEKAGNLGKTLTVSQEIKEQSLGRHSCKRKLVDDDDDSERPSKRVNKCRSPEKENNENLLQEGSIKNTESGIKSISNAENATIQSVSDSENISVKDSPRKRNTALKNLDSDINSSPDKNVQEGHLEFYSPARAQHLKIDKKTLASPTSNLPNLVMDSPVSSKKITNKENEDTKKSKIDWLTQMRMQKLAKQGTKSCSKKLADKYAQNPVSEPPAQNKENQQSQGNQKNLEDLLKCKVSLENKN